MMEDDLIDDSGFELGMPTHEDMLKHQCTLLCAELETTRHDLCEAHRNIAKLIVMHRDSLTELAALKVEYERLKWALSDMYHREREREASGMDMRTVTIPEARPSSWSAERCDADRRKLPTCLAARTVAIAE